jgi:ABC-type multidrug transport system fused ATPase/permease subunit
MDPNVILNRIGRLARLDTSVFDEVKDDPKELVPALIIAAVSAILAGLGAWLFWEVVPEGSWDSTFVNALILGSIFLALMYGVAVLIAYVVLVQVYGAQANLQALFTTMGYAALPLALSVLMFIPLIYPLFAVVPMGLLLVMMIYAVRATTTAQPEQAVIAASAGFAVMVLILGIFAISSSVPDAPIGAGIFAFFLDF